MIEIDVRSAHFDALQGIVAELNAALERELRAANGRIGARVSGDARRILNEKVYSVEIPFRTGATASQRRRFAGTSRQIERGRRFRRWTRTGDLLRAETWALRTEGRGAHAVVLTNGMAYAVYRHDLGTDRSSRKAGEQTGQSPTRVCEWQREAVAKNRDWIREQYAAAVERALGRRP